MAQARIDVAHYHGIVVRIELAYALVLVVGRKTRVRNLYYLLLISQVRLLHLAAESVPVLRCRIRAEQVSFNRIKMRHIILKRRSTLASQTIIVGIRTIWRGITMNVNARNLHVLVLAHKVYCLHYLCQFTWIVEQIYHYIRFVYAEA